MTLTVFEKHQNETYWRKHPFEYYYKIQKEISQYWPPENLKVKHDNQKK